ncbi:MAG TPA: lipopolysaccharide transport periplasmic protein LptA [Rhodocyclaceae bacterium]|nr:lipopolysaccharide transport periplasmic protein LptA [Rhodocyclaceae bacterium]
MNAHCRTLLPALTALVALTALPALAERADRDKPVNLEANRITVDDAKKVQVLEGNVQLVQGTLIIRAEKLVVSQDAEGFQKGIAYGGSGRLATFRQKREGKDEFVDGEAERIEYDGKADKVELFKQARVKSGLDEVNGQYISFDGKTENYLATGGSPEAGKGAGTERVRAIIQPKNKDAAKSGGPATTSPTH